MPPTLNVSWSSSNPTTGGGLARPSSAGLDASVSISVSPTSAFATRAALDRGSPTHPPEPCAGSPSSRVMARLVKAVQSQRPRKSPRRNGGTTVDKAWGELLVNPERLREFIQNAEVLKDISMAAMDEASPGRRSADCRRLNLLPLLAALGIDRKKKRAATAAAPDDRGRETRSDLRPAALRSAAPYAGKRFVFKHHAHLTLDPSAYARGVKDVRKRSADGWTIGKQVEVDGMVLFLPRKKEADAQQRPWEAPLTITSELADMERAQRLLHLRQDKEDKELQKQYLASASDYSAEMIRLQLELNADHARLREERRRDADEAAAAARAAAAASAAACASSPLSSSSPSPRSSSPLSRRAHSRQRSATGAVRDQLFGTGDDGDAALPACLMSHPRLPRFRSRTHVGAALRPSKRLGVDEVEVAEGGAGGGGGEGGGEEAAEAARAAAEDAEEEARFGVEAEERRHRVPVRVACNRHLDLTLELGVWAARGKRGSSGGALF